MQRKVLSIAPKRRFETLTNVKVSKDTALNLNNFRKDVELLKQHSNMKISEFTSNNTVREAFERVRELLKTVSAVKSSYTELRNIVDEQFKDLMYPVPYTIGAHFRGWNVTTTMDNTEFESCVAVRLHALQQPGYINKCKHVAMYADWVNDKFVFTSDATDPQIETRSLDKVIINVPFSDVNSFPGFSKEEREELARNGVTDVCIIGFRPGSNNYEHLTNATFVSLDRVKLRHSTGNVRIQLNKHSSNTQQYLETKKHGKHNNSSGSYAWIFMIAILLIVLIAFFFFMRK